MKNLKLLHLASLILFSFVFISCSSDDDSGPSGPSVSNDLYGTWNLSYYQEGNEGTVTDFPCSEDLEYKFNSDNTFSKINFSGDDNTNCNEGLIINGDWEIIDETTINLIPSVSSQPDEEISFQLLNNGTELKIFRDGGRVEDYRRP